MLTTAPAQATFDAADRPATASHGLVRLWLGGVAALVFLMVMVGGATRLTDSGLSITEWQPILGAIPPLTDADWQAAFDKYRQIPQYQQMNRGMSLAAFKVIFYWEWAHRLLGRLIGVVFALPLAWFWATGRLPRSLRWPLVGLFLLGGLQGAIGWYMVQSGLTDRISVSPYRLALHLTMAIVILGLLVWTALELAPASSSVPERPARSSTAGLRWRAGTLVCLLIIQIVAGAFVAGHKAGLTYNTWPLMDGALVPAGLGTLSPWWMNAVENITTIQFNHRTLAYLLVLLVAWQAVSVWQRSGDASQRLSALLLAAGVVGQMGLGIATLLWVTDARIPLALGVAHQAGAAALFAAAVWHCHAVVGPRRSPTT